MRYPFGDIFVGPCGADLHNNLRKWGKSCPLIGQGALNLNSYTFRWLKTWLSLSYIGLLSKREFKLLQKRWSDIITIYWYIESAGQGALSPNSYTVRWLKTWLSSLHSIPFHSTPLQFLDLLYKFEFKLLRKRWSAIVTIYWYIESGSGSGSGSGVGFSLKGVMFLFVCLFVLNDWPYNK